MAKGKGGTSDEDLLRAAWDLYGDMCLEHTVQVGGLWLPGLQRGVFIFRARAFRTVPNSRPVQAAAYEAMWPSSQNLSLGGVFFRCANQLDHLLEKADTARAADEAQERH